VNHAVSHEDMMRYLDDELASDRKAAVAAHIESCTECRREYVVFQSIKGEVRSLLDFDPGGPSVWSGVNRRIMLPTAWLLIVGGTLALSAWGIWAWLSSPEEFWEKFLVGAVVVGFALLLLSAIGDRLRDLKTDPYREIQR